MLYLKSGFKFFEIFQNALKPTEKYILNISLYHKNYFCLIQNISKNKIILSSERFLEDMDYNWLNKKIKGVISFFENSHIKSYFFKAKIQDINLAKNQIIIGDFKKQIFFERRREIRYNVPLNKINYMVFYEYEKYKPITKNHDLTDCIYIIKNNLLKSSLTPILIGDVSATGISFELHKLLFHRFKSLIDFSKKKDLIVFFNIDDSIFFKRFAIKNTLFNSKIRIGCELIDTFHFTDNGHYITVNKSLISCFL